MKQKDIAIIIVVGVISFIVAIFASNFAFSQTGSKDLKAEVVQPINANFDQPNNKYFNSQSVDPTETITIGSNDNKAPFTAAQ